MDNRKFYLQLQKDAEVFAQKAMDILVSMQGKESVSVQKDEIDQSTSADVAAETSIIEQIRKKYPAHAISSEEIGEIKGSDTYRWVIDPLDQTKEYRRGWSEFNSLVAVENNGQIVMGVTLQHGVNAMYGASLGNGSHLNGKSCHVSNQSNIENSFIGYNLPNRKMEPTVVKNNLSLLYACIPIFYRVRPFWDQSKAMSLVASGILDGNIAPPHITKWHDIASSIILVKEAGGKVTDFYGNPVTEKTYENGVVASNGILHEQLLQIVQKSNNATY